MIDTSVWCQLVSPWINVHIKVKKTKQEQRNAKNTKKGFKKKGWPDKKKVTFWNWWDNTYIWWEHEQNWVRIERMKRVTRFCTIDCVSIQEMSITCSKIDCLLHNYVIIIQSSFVQWIVIAPYLSHFNCPLPIKADWVGTGKYGCPLLRRYSNVTPWKLS